jgi:hypothetical protein
VRRSVVVDATDLMMLLAWAKETEDGMRSEGWVAGPPADERDCTWSRLFASLTGDDAGAHDATQEGSGK